MGNTRKTLQELNLMDDFLMNAVATNEEVAEPFCRRVLSVLLQREIGELKIVAQRSVPATDPEKRGIRMDVEIKEYAGPSEANVAELAQPIRVYDLEPHRKGDIDMIRHNRFYQAKIDSRYIKSGERDFSKMPELYIITITDYDLFGQGYMMYTVENQCKELPEMPYEDGLHFMYFYTGGTKGGNEDIKIMLEYFKSSTKANAVNEATQEIHGYISKVKVSSEAEVEFMKYDDLVWESENRGRKEGRIEGRQEGRIEGRQATLLEMLEELGEIPEEIREIICAQTDVDILREWSKLAIKAESVEDWQSQIL